MSQAIHRVIERYPALASCESEMTAALELFGASFASGHKLLVCGNGGSAADSEHIVGELMKAFVRRRPIPVREKAKLEQLDASRGAAIAARLQGALPALALTSQVSLTSAVANDVSYEMVFAQQVYALGKSGDALLGISTSGNSENVLNAILVAKAQGMQTVALTGRNGGHLAVMADVCVKVPADVVAEIQELHLPVYHAWCIGLEERFFAE